MTFEQDRSGYESNLPRPVDTASGNGLRGPSTGGSGHDEEHSRRLDSVLNTSSGVDKLLNRLKQSIYSARDFSSFLKERHALEDRYAQGYKKLVRNAHESIRSPLARQGSYSRNFGESLRINERLADNGVQYASALHTMAEELREMADTAEKGRKHWKHTAMDAEKKVADAENAQLKAKEKYTNAADQYDKVRTGEKQGGKFGLKNKNPAQLEEQLKEKTDTLDQEYAAKTLAAQEAKREFENSMRPNVVRNLRDIISESDAALAMQMAKLASLSEKHVVGNGMAIAPIRASDSSSPAGRGLRQVAADIDDRKDFSDYVLHGADPPPQYKGRSRRNTDAELVHTPMHSTPQIDRSDTFDSPYNGNRAHIESDAPQLPQIGGEQDTFASSFGAPRPPIQNQNSSFITGEQDNLYTAPTNQSQQTGVIQDRTPSLSAGRGPPTLDSLPSYDRGQAPLASSFASPTSYDRNQSSAPHDSSYDGRQSFDQSQGHAAQSNAFDGRPSFDKSQGPPRQDTLPSAMGRGQSQTGGTFGSMGRGAPAPGSYMDPGKSAGQYGGMTSTARDRTQSPPATRNLPSQQAAKPTLPPLNPVFGVHLDDLFRRDGSAVPAIVFQCIQAVDQFGLYTEGIYRTSGSSPTVMQLKSEFDHDSSKVDLHSPAIFNQDIASVATTLKTFLRDLPDALLTTAAYSAFIKAAQFEDPIMRRDALHQYINSLPDPNYATLRVLTLHLHRVSRESEVNKMDIRNLAIVFGPTVMGSGPGSGLAGELGDAQWQTRVLETILMHTHDIFDPDE